jgi:hypothetical protein
MLSNNKPLPNSKEYQDRELANQLIFSPEWLKLLKPLLEKASTETTPPLTNLDSSFQVARHQGKQEFSRYLLHYLERLGKEFPDIKEK